MKNPAYILGFLCGIGIVALAVVLLRYVAKKKTGLFSSKYDERQLAAQGKGYKYAYFTLLVMVVLGGIIDQSFAPLPIDLFSYSLLCLWISLCVFITYCIAHDAYLELKTKSRTLCIILLAAGLVNVALGLANAIWDDSMLVEGKLQLAFTNLVTGVCCLYVALALHLRAWAIRREEEEE